MSSSDGEGPGGPGGTPKPPASSTLAGIPAQRDPGGRAPLPPPKVPPGGRPHSPSTAPVSGPMPTIPGHAPSAPAPSHAPPSHAPPSHAPSSHAPTTNLPVAAAPAGWPGQTAPRPFSAHPQPQPFAAPPGHPIAAQHQPAFVQAHPPTAPALGAHRPADSLSSMEEVPGSQFVKFLKISLRRAFRLRIESREVLLAERASLEAARPPIHDANLQAFLAWRRSVLFLVAVALVPLSIIGLVDAMAGSMPTAIRLVKLAPALAEGLFCWICWTQLRRWAHWRTQRRRLFWGWLLFMATPFVVFLYPLSTAIAGTAANARDVVAHFGIGDASGVKSFVFAMIAMLQLAPKAISLMPGLIRASLVIKLLFPGSTAPGWLIVMCAPLYALLAYVILIVPYQFTGNGWFIGGVLGLICGQVVLARAGFALARPLAEDEALRAIRRVRALYIIVMLASAVLVLIALGSLVVKLNMRITDVITAVMKFETNVLILTMIGADLVITNLDRARSHTVGRGHVEEQAEVKIAAFVSLEAPSTPPPVGPAA